MFPFEGECLIFKLFEGSFSSLSNQVHLLQFREEDMFGDLYIGVTKETQRTTDSGILTPEKSLDFYKVIGQNK